VAVAITHDGNSSSYAREAGCPPAVFFAAVINIHLGIAINHKNDVDNGIYDSSTAPGASSP
jgi:hypothetical protein